MPIDEKAVHNEDVIKAQRATRATAGVATQTNHPSAHGLWQGKELRHFELDAIADTDAKPLIFTRRPLIEGFRIGA